MDVLQVVAKEQKSSASLRKLSQAEPTVEACVRMNDILRRNERITERRERLMQAVADLEGRMEMIMSEILRVKEKYKLT